MLDWFLWRIFAVGWTVYVWIGSESFHIERSRFEPRPEFANDNPAPVVDLREFHSNSYEELNKSGKINNRKKKRGDCHPVLLCLCLLSDWL